MSVVPALQKLSPSENDITAVASIHYGLSPYPEHPRLPSSPDDPSRNNVHPQHISDILTALRWLQDEYGFGQNYVLAGHSCGATLAFQTLTRSLGSISQSVDEPRKDLDRLPVLPLAVVGLSGIYDMKLLVQDHADVAVYRQFTERAFGKNESAWKIASPVDWGYSALWPEGRVTVLGHSYEDQLVNWKQTDAMSDLLKREATALRKDIVFKTTGEHDDAWIKGDDLAKGFLRALAILHELGSQA